MDKKYTIHLHGYLTKFDKSPIVLYANSVKDCIRGLICIHGDQFRETISAGQWHVTTGNCGNKPKSTDKFVDENTYHMHSADDEIHIYPAIAGAGGKPGMMGILMGVLMIAAIFLLPAVGIALAEATIAMMWVGAGLSIIGGIVTMATTKTPKMNYNEANVDRKASFLYNGPVNTVEQGGPVPLVYGRHLVGSTVISVGMDVEQLL